jgi:hypothetical protein
MIQLRMRAGYEFERYWVPLDNLVFNDFDKLKEYYTQKLAFIEDKKQDLILNPRESDSVFKYEDQEEGFDQAVIYNTERYYNNEIGDILRYQNLCVTVYLTKGD